MSDLKQRIFEIIKDFQLSSFATITEDGKPWTRYVSIVGDKDLNVRFSTFIGSRKVAQISKNPEVHITCGVLDPQNFEAYLQIQGTAELTTAQAEREGFWNDYIKNIFKGPDDPNYGVIIVKPYRVELCKPGVFVPEVWEA